MSFLEKLYKEEIVWLTIGHATRIVDEPDCQVYQVMDYESDECYLLQNDELLDLEPLIDTEFYRLRWAIEETKKRNHLS